MPHSDCRHCVIAFARPPKQQHRMSSGRTGTDLRDGDYDDDDRRVVARDDRETWGGKAMIALPVANDMANAPAQPEAQVQPLADLPVQSTQPLAELLPAQAAAELVQPGPAALAELHNTSKRRWTRIRIQKTSVQPLAELRHQWS